MCQYTLPRLQLFWKYFISPADQVITFILSGIFCHGTVNETCFLKVWTTLNEFSVLHLL